MATIKMDVDGSFTLQNIGNRLKSLVSMTGNSVAPGQVAAVSPSCLIEPFEEAEKGSEELLEWAKEKVGKGCEATDAEAGDYIQSAKEAMEQIFRL